jgi:hypothetical protein
MANSIIQKSLKSEVDALNGRFRTITSGSIKDIKKSGIYYLTWDVTDKPIANGGIYIVGSFRDAGNALCGLFLGAYSPDQGIKMFQTSDGENFHTFTVGTFKTTVSGTTSGSGAIAIPIDTIGDAAIVFIQPTNFTGFVFTRDRSYFTCMNNDLSAPIANTNVTFDVFYSPVFK